MLLHRRGFTLIEVATVSGLTAFLGILLSSTWMGVSRSTVDLVGRGRLVQELDMAVASLSRDLGGSLAVKAYSTDADNLGGENKGVWIGYKPDAGSANGELLQLCFDGGDYPNGKADWASPTDDTIVEYRLESYTNSHGDTSYVLVRQEDAGTEFVVAKNVGSFVVDVSDPDYIKIELTLQYPYPDGEHVRKCKLVVKTPQ